MSSRALRWAVLPVLATVFIAGCAQGPGRAASTPRVPPPALSSSQPPGGAAVTFTDITVASEVSRP